jgi:hypothetical protein
VLGGLALLLLDVPMLVGVVARSATAGIIAGTLLRWMTTAILWVDRLGGLVGLARAGGPALIALIGLALAARAIRRGWSEPFDNGNARAAGIRATGIRATVIPAATVVVALVALSQPFYYYPDVDTHARYLAAARADPRLLTDPGDYQARTGAWTREVGGRRVAFPYSPVFHVLAWPVAAIVGDELAVKCLAATALGLTVFLVHVLARCLGFGAGAALLAQGLVVALPVTASRLVLALFPALLAQALELLLIVFLARAIDPAGRERAGWALFLLLTLCQAAYTGSLLNVAVLVTVLTAIVAASGDRVGALRLAGLYLAATSAVVAAQYARFLPVLWRDVLPHVASTAGTAGAHDHGGVASGALRRLGLFYDVVYPLMLVPGLRAVRGAPAPARRVVAAALLAGGALLVLRYAIPVVFRDAKEVELLAGPVAVLAAGGGLWLWRRGRVHRIAAVLALLTAAAWGAHRAALAYGERFVAVGR